MVYITQLFHGASPLEFPEPLAAAALAFDAQVLKPLFLPCGADITDGGQRCDIRFSLVSLTGTFEVRAGLSLFFAAAQDC